MSTLHSAEIKIIAVLSGVFVLRMLGLFMILPVFSLEVGQFTDATPSTIGFALGVYGLTQALLQIPLGYLSDRFGRKQILLGGLLILLGGSLLASIATNMMLLIAGRALQGAGAIGCVVMATLADYTRDVVRTRAMALLGVSIALSFLLAMGLGPILNKLIGLSGLFCLTAVLALIGIVGIVCYLPTSNAMTKQSLSNQTVSQGLWQAITTPKLLGLHLSVASLHAILAALFLVVPNLFIASGCLLAEQAYLYLPILSVAMLFAWPQLRDADKGDQQKRAILWLVVLMCALGLLAFFRSLFLGIVASLILFFTVFCLLEAALPARVSKVVTSQSRGLHMGIFSSMQFGGVFLGASFGGWCFEKFGMMGVLLLCIAITVVWFIALWFLKPFNDQVVEPVVMKKVASI